MSESKKKYDYPLLSFEQCGLKNVSVAENQHCAGGGAGVHHWEGENSFMSPCKDYKVPVSQNMFYCYLFYSFIGKYCESFSSLTCMILVTESTIVGGIDRWRFRFRISEASSSATRHVQIAVF